jgi:hypothetical protein
MTIELWMAKLKGKTTSISENKGKPIPSFPITVRKSRIC